MIALFLLNADSPGRISYKDPLGQCVSVCVRAFLPSYRSEIAASLHFIGEIIVSLCSLCSVSDPGQGLAL